MNKPNKPAQFRLQRECRDAAQDQAGYEQGKPKAYAAEMIGFSHGLDESSQVWAATSMQIVGSEHFVNLVSNSD
jgi:hypothetical protein